MRDRLVKGMMDKIKHMRYNGHPASRLPGNISVSMEYVEGESILLFLNMNGIAASSGSACTSRALKASHVLTAMGVPIEVTHGSLLLTLGRFNTDEDVDYVLCTHMHVDHVGWNTRLVDGRWEPTFPNARYLFAEKEWRHWSREPQEYGPVVEDSVQPIFDRGLADLVSETHRVTDEITLEPTPGHTPGHVSVHITSRGEEAVITGDMIHHPCQIAHPHWSSSADVDPFVSATTRDHFLQRYADRPVLIIGTHFAAPTAGRIVHDGDSYRLDY